MTLPLFYVSEIEPVVTLDEPTSKHIIGVLRMKPGDELMLTNGKGSKATGTITDGNRKRCTVQVLHSEKEETQPPQIAVAVSVIKNASRFEWLLEKATEIGVNKIIPLVCERTERQTFRFDRMHGILVSAMLQSQQSWLPVLHGPTPFEKLISEATQQARFIAHCLPEEKSQLSEANSRFTVDDSRLILIGPEGDFTEKEIVLALQNNFTPVALGHTRLRTETAGMVAAALLRLPQH